MDTNRITITSQEEWNNFLLKPVPTYIDIRSTEPEPITIDLIPVNCHVDVHDSSHVIAWGSVFLTARDSSRIELWDHARAEALDYATITAHDFSHVDASDYSFVKSYDKASTTAHYSTHVEAYDTSRIRAFDTSHITARDESCVWGYGDEVDVFVCGNAVCFQYGKFLPRTEDNASVIKVC